MRRDPVSAVFSTGNATTRAVPAGLIPIGLAELCAATSTVLGEDKLLRTSSPPTRAPQRSKAALPWLPAFRSWETDQAHAPEAVTRTPPELSPSTHSFLRPPAPNWQVACGIYPRASCILPYWQGFWPID